MNGHLQMPTGHRCMQSVYSNFSHTNEQKYESKEKNEIDVFTAIKESEKKNSHQ